MFPPSSSEYCDAYHYPERLVFSPSVPTAGVGHVEDGGHDDMGDGRRYYHEFI